MDGEPRRDDDEVGPLGVCEKLTHQFLVLFFVQTPLGLAPAIRFDSNNIETFNLSPQPLRSVPRSRTVR
ncbi:MAG: hypothetical protein CXT65_06280 [Methanobacteriota archaeon]|nr:MAG: hypothetical protein CXT65_06280 [Euryarchaeota archaeon]